MTADACVRMRGWVSDAKIKARVSCRPIAGTIFTVCIIHIVTDCFVIDTKSTSGNFLRL